jgi:hypothetical protein
MPTNGESHSLLRSFLGGFGSKHWGSRRRKRKPQNYRAQKAARRRQRRR